VTRHLDFTEWQKVRRQSLPQQVAILAGDARPAGPGPAPLRSHARRSEAEWQAIADGVRALLAQRVSSGSWTWTGPRRVEVGGPVAIRR
jgi:hypothetical protein